MKGFYDICRNDNIMISINNRFNINIEDYK